MKEKYICAVPFTSFEIQDKENYLCCASWLTKSIPKGTSIKNSWNSVEANEIRESILDGSYRYCDENQCPFLSQIQKFGKIREESPLYLKANLPEVVKQQIINFRDNKIEPHVIQFSFDRSCNLKCPTCRIGIITANSKKIKEVETTIQEIEDTYSNVITTLYITGSGDPFISVGFRNFLRNFNKDKYPNLKQIHLHTNATKWNKKMWNSMKNIHPYVKSCEISIDAGTKDTYENITRIGGNWDELLENLKFISTIPTLKRIKPSFVVQKGNYREMKVFYELMISIFGNKSSIFYGKVNNWGTFSEEEFNEIKVWDEKHPEYSNFLNEVNNTLPAKNTWSNLQEFITPTKYNI